MPTNLLKFGKGSVLQFTTGEYSDFRTCGLLVTTQAVDLPTLAQQMTAGKESYADGACASDFAAWLIANGYAMPVCETEIHLGSYGRWEPEFGVSYTDADG